MYTLVRLQTVANVIQFWDFIAGALEELAAKHKIPFDLEATQKLMHWMVIDHERCWFGVVFDQRKNPVAFAVVCDATAPYEQEKVWAVKWFYHSPGSFEATLFLKKVFDNFAKTHNIGKYLVTTSRLSGGAIRCFQSEKFGFKKAYLTFETSP